MPYSSHLAVTLTQVLELGINSSIVELLFLFNLFSEDSDYDRISQTLEFNAEISTHSVPVNILSDDLVEPDEHFFAELATSQQNTEEQKHSPWSKHCSDDYSG